MKMDQLEILDPAHSILDSIDRLMHYFQDSFYPLLFMPLTGKTYSTISDFKDVIIDKAIELFRLASDVYLIGYSANDDLIHELLSNSPNKTKLHVVGRLTADSISTNTLSRNQNLIKGEVCEEGFRYFANNY